MSEFNSRDAIARILNHERIRWARRYSPLALMALVADGMTEADAAKKLSDESEAYAKL